MSVAPTRVGRLRGLTVTPQTFRATAFAALAAIYVVITTGAVVRLTASGLGCDHWPKCGNAPFPEQGSHAFIEFSNRVVAIVTIGFTLANWLVARRVVGAPRWVTSLALAMFLGNVAQIPLGGLTVIFHLNPLLVISHFLLAMLVLACGVVVAVEAQRLLAGEGVIEGPSWLRPAAIVLVLSCFALVVAGAFATAAGPHAGGADVHRLGQALRSVRIHGAFTILFGVSFVAVLVFLERNRRTLGRLADLAFVVLGVLVAQVAVGEVQYRTSLPWWLVLVHVSLAALVWAGTVALAALLVRPARSFVTAAA